MIGSGEIAVVIDLATLVGMDDTPGQVPGMGPVPASVARELAADRRWRAWLTDSRSAGSQIVATSPGTYRPPAALARLLRARAALPHARLPFDDHRSRPCGSLPSRVDHGRQPAAVVPSPSSDEDPHPLAPGTTEAGTGWRWTSPAGITYEDSPSRRSVSSSPFGR